MAPNAGSGVSLVNLGPWAEPANTLVLKISDAVGGMFGPSQIRRLAKAKADAALTEAHSQIEITDLHKRAARRWIEEEARRQKNMEDIAAKALPLLEETANPTAVDDDWLVHFFAKCRMVNDQQMQQLWSRVLAGEANGPGSFAKRTIGMLAGLEAAEAKWFTELCGYVFDVGEMVPLVFDSANEVYNRRQITLSTLIELESVGLIQWGGVAGFRVKGLPRKPCVYYYGRELCLEMPQESDNELDVGKVLLTRMGRELAPICGSQPVEGFWEYVRVQWKALLPQPRGE